MTVDGGLPAKGSPHPSTKAFTNVDKKQLSS